MTAERIDGKSVAEDIRGAISGRVASLKEKTGRVPGLAAVLVGDDPASEIYVGHKKKGCAAAGMHAPDLHLPASTSQAELLDRIRELNEDPAIHGILVQLPLPDHIDSSEVQHTVSPAKDVDCFHPENVGRFYAGNPLFIPCTPRGALELIDRTGTQLKGKRAVVVGRSNIVGKPMAFLLLSRHATVTLCHSRTTDLPGVCREADVLVAAVGKPRMLGGDCIKEGAVVIDVGTNAVLVDGKRKLVGDVDYEAASQKASYITPVPGGVGPMTIAMLLMNTVEAAERLIGV